MVFAVWAAVLMSVSLSCSPPESAHQASEPNGTSTANESADEAPPDRPGHWRRVRLAGSAEVETSDQQVALERLRTLGYVSGSRVPSTAEIVTIYDRERAEPGLNLYVSGHAPEAILMDMEGRPLHRWQCPIATALPGFPAEQLHPNGRDFWRRAHVFENGDLLAIFEGAGIFKLDRDSNVLWARPNRAHHDLEVMPNGDIYVLTHRIHVVPRVHPETAIAEDFVTVLDADGVEKARVSLLDCVEKLVEKKGWEMPWLDDGDIFHTNTVQVVRPAAAANSPAFSAGDVLVSLRSINLIGCVDMEQAKFKWFLASGRPVDPHADGTPRLFFKLQHEPQLLDNGRVLLFDNNGLPQQSTVWEFDPVTKEVAWYYRGTEEQPFYSDICGAARRLPGGNTLIVESENGRVFEVTQDKEIVWEFFNPHRAGEDLEFIAMIPDFVRLPASFPISWATPPTDD